jgi:hypothetical protein
MIGLTHAPHSSAFLCRVCEAQVPLVHSVESARRRQLLFILHVAHHSYFLYIMGRWQPYLYNAPQEVDTFNPKAVTMASRQPPSPTKKPDGPLVNFNRHPDSYVILPYGKTEVKPMGSNVKKIITIVRWIQFSLRLSNLLGAVGALLCSIFIKGTQSTEGYILKIPVSLWHHAV